MRKDGIQTRKRKPKKAANGAKPNMDATKKEGHSSPGIDGMIYIPTNIDVLCTICCLVRLNLN